MSLKPIASTPSIVKAAEELPILETGTMVPYDDLEVRVAAALGRVRLVKKNRLAKDEGDGRRGQVAQLPVSYRGPRRVGVPKPGRGAGAPATCAGGAGAWGFAYRRGRCSGAFCCTGRSLSFPATGPARPPWTAPGILRCAVPVFRQLG